MSFALHAAAILALSLMMVRIVEPGRRVSPLIVTESTEAEIIELDLTDLDVHVPAESLKVDSALKAFAASRVTDALTDTAALDPLRGQQGGDEVVRASDTGSPDIEWPAEVPANAVQAGSFLAWWIPKVQRFGETVEAGQLPRAGQDYHIHLQIRIPDGRTSWPLTDLSGEIVGSDGYRQQIPDRAYVSDRNGDLTRAPRQLTVRGQIAEVVFRVDGAGQSGVRDRITVRSRLLNEQQVLTLEFIPREQ